MNISSTSHKIIWKHWVLEILLWKLDLYEWNEVQILIYSYSTDYIFYLII